MSNNKHINELYASNKQLNTRVNSMHNKMESDNKEMITLLKNINTSLKTLLLQNNKIIEKINNLEGNDDTKKKYLNNKLIIDTKLQEMNVQDIKNSKK